jgi:polysaccharide biosynthesis transport protein
MFQPIYPIAKAAIAPAQAVRAEEAPAALRIDPARIWAFIKRNKHIIARTTAASFVAMLLFVALVRHQYTAVTQLLIDPSDLRVVDNGLTPTNQIPEAVVLQVESQVRVLTSDNVLRRVIIELKLDEDSEFAGGQSLLRRLLFPLVTPFGFDHGGRNDPTLAALSELQRHIKVRRAERTYVIDVGATTGSREKSARIANAIADAYLAEQAAARSEAARRASGSLSARLAELKDRVREAEERVETFKAKNNIVGAGQLVGEQQLHELNNQLTIARTRTAEAKARFEQIEYLQRTGAEVGAFTEAVQSQTLAPLRAQYAEIMRREAEQSTTLGARHPAVIEVRAQAERLRRVIAEEVNRIALATRSEYERTRANEEALARTLEGLKRNTFATNEALVQLRELERDVQAGRAVYESFLVRARETGEQGGLDTKNVRIISKADLPLYRSWPPANLVLAVIALMLGIGSGVGWGFLREWRRGGGSLEPRSPRAPRQPERPAPVAEVMPAFPVLAELPGIIDAPPIGAADESGLAIASEMRKVYDAVRANHKKSAGATVLVVAPHEGDDTTAVALHLASVAAATDRVLLIDADVNRRTLSALVSEPPEAGLVDVAVGRKLLSGAVIEDLRTKITALPLVSPKSRRKGAINEEDLKAAFEQTKRFDVVIVVAPNSDKDPSARFFAALVDHVVLVQGPGETGRRALDQLVAMLHIDVRKVRGTVLMSAKAA